MIPDDPYGEIQMLVAGLPDSATTIVAKSKEFRNSDEIDLAFALLERAVARDPAPILLVEHADLLASEGQTDEAVAEAMRALQDDPQSTYAREVLRRALLGDLPEAAGQVATAAHWFDTHDDPEYAEELLRSATEKQPKSVFLRERLAQFYANRRRVADCVVVLQELLRLEPEHDEAQLMLAAAFLKQGDLPRAQRLLNKARKRGVASPMLEELEAKIGAVMGVIAKSKS